MLLSQTSRTGGQNAVESQGLSQLRRQLEHPEQLDEASRSYLSDLQRRLEKLRARGGDYGQINFSRQAQDALCIKTAG